jgi:hypothetical protein
MADLDIPNFADDDRPIALRKMRRSSSGVKSRPRSSPQVLIPRSYGISSPPQTPKRSRKRVRFSDPGPEIQSELASSGLTPFIRRTSLSAPTSNRRHSAPITLWNRAGYDVPLSGTIQFEPLRQVLDGRVRRRLRRNRLSEEVNNIEWDKRQEAKARKTEVEKLRRQLEQKDLEMQTMRDEQDLASQIEGESGISVTTDSIKVRELEQQIVDLKAALQEKESDTTQDPNWTMAARDPFDFDDDDDDDNDMMITNYDEDFGESTMNDELLTTPTRLNTSLLSPPSTMLDTPYTSTSFSNGTQTTDPVPDPEKEALRAQLESLQSEISKLTSTIAFNYDNRSRLTEKLSQFLPVDESRDHSSLDSALDTVLTQLALSQSHAVERSNAFSALSTEIASLGFSSCSGPEEMLATIAAQFRQARLDLEYLTPGEVVEGFENEKLLDMLVSRIRVLLQKVKESDDSIDQYHEQEVLLRQQINTHVGAFDDVQKELCLANTVVGDLRSEIQEKETTNERLRTALEGYRDEVKGLENLIERMEREEVLREEMFKSEVKEVADRLQSEILRHDTTRASEEGKDIINMELERRLNAALQAVAEVQEQITALAASKESLVAEKELTIQQLQSSGINREREHGEALALRDARISELRGEIERVNEALNSAHSTILTLRKENNELETRIQGERTRGQLVVQSMREQLNRVLDTGLGYLNGDTSLQMPNTEGTTPDIGSSTLQQAVVRSGRFLDADLAKRSAKKRRRYDSGLGFLEEEDTGEMDMGVEV